MFSMGSYNASRRRDRCDEEFARDRRWTHAYSRQGHSGPIRDTGNFNRVQSSEFHPRDRVYHGSYRKRRYLDEDSTDYRFDERCISGEDPISYQTDFKYPKHFKNSHYWERRENSTGNSDRSSLTRAKSLEMMLHHSKFYNMESDWNKSQIQKVGLGDSDHCHDSDPDYCGSNFYKFDANRRTSEDHVNVQEKNWETTHSGADISESICHSPDGKNTSSLLSNFKPRSTIFGYTGYSNMSNKFGNTHVYWRKACNSSCAKTNSALCLDADDVVQTKKPRLGWGEGLAKYENQSVSGPVNNRGRNGLVKSDILKMDSTDRLNPVIKSLGATVDKPECHEKFDEHLCPPREESFEAASHDILSSATRSVLKHGNLIHLTEDLHLDHLSFFTKGESPPHTQHLDERIQMDVNSIAKEVAQMKGEKHSSDTLLDMKGELLQKLELVEAELDAIEKELGSLEVGTDPESCCSKENSPFHLSRVPLVSAEASFEQPLLETETNTGYAITSTLYQKQTVIQAGLTTSDSQISCLNKESADDCTQLDSDTKDKTLNLSKEVTCFELQKLSEDLSGRSLPVLADSASNLVSMKNVKIFTGENTCLLHEIKTNDLLKLIHRCKRSQRFKKQILSLKFRILRAWRGEQKWMLKSSGKESGNINGFKRTKQPLSSFMTALSGIKSSPLVRVPALNVDVSCYRSFLKMPAMHLDEKEIDFSKFVTNNGLVEDPVAVEEERKLINPWTQLEKDIFWEKYAVLRKQFHQIASYLRHKTVADCVEYYYKYHKIECPKELKKQDDFKWQGCSSHDGKYLAISKNRRRCLTDETPLDVLGTVAAITMGSFNQNFRSKVSRCLPPQKMNEGCPLNYRGKSNVDYERELKCTVNFPNGIQGCSTSVGFYKNGVCNKQKVLYRNPEIRVYLSRKGSYDPLISEAEFETCNFSEECLGYLNKDWTDSEKSIFVDAVGRHGKNFQSISALIHSKTEDECRTFFCKARKSLKLDELVHQEGTVENQCAISGEVEEKSIEIQEAGAPMVIAQCCKIEDASNLLVKDAAAATVSFEENKGNDLYNLPASPVERKNHNFSFEDVRDCDLYSPSSCMEGKAYKFTQDEQTELDELWETCKRNLGMVSASEHDEEKLLLSGG